MSIGERTTASMLSYEPWKSGTSTSTRAGVGFDLIAHSVAAKCAAPPSGRSSRSTDVTTTCCRPSRATAAAIRRGSSASSGRTLPCATAQYGQLRVHTSPISMKVAVRCEKHSPIFGQHASWQTECSLSSARIPLVRKYSGDVGARTLIQSGCLRSGILSNRALRRRNRNRARRNDFVVVKNACEAVAHHAGELTYRYCATGHLAHGRHAAAVDPARDDRIEVAEIGRYVQREAVPGSPAADADADRSDLARADPYASHRIAARRFDTELGERVDHRSFQIAQILGHVAVAAFEFEYRIADQLSGTVIGHLSAARYATDRHAGVIVHDEALVGAAAESEDVRMLHQQQHVADAAVDPRRKHRGLYRERVVIIE